MTNYTVVKNTGGDIQSIRRDDGASIPVCGGNRDYQQYLEYAATYTYPVEIIPDPEPAGKSIDEQLADIRAALFELEGI